MATLVRPSARPKASLSAGKGRHRQLPAWAKLYALRTEDAAASRAVKMTRAFLPRAAAPTGSSPTATAPARSASPNVDNKCSVTAPPSALPARHRPPRGWRCRTRAPVRGFSAPFSDTPDRDTHTRPAPTSCRWRPAGSRPPAFSQCAAAPFCPSSRGSLRTVAAVFCGASA